MSRTALPFIFALLAVPAQAQDSYGPAAEEPEPEQVQTVDEAPVRDEGLPTCDETTPGDGTIVVCALRVDPETVMSPLPRPVDPYKGAPRAPLMAEPPCWITKDKTLCVRFGYVPPWPPMIDMSKFPEPLSAEDAARVFAAPEEASETATDGSQVGRRVAIPLED